MTVSSLMIMSVVCNGMQVVSTKTTAKAPAATDTRRMDNLVLPPMAITVQLDEQGRVVKVLDCRDIDLNVLYGAWRNQEDDASSALKTSSLGEGLSLVGVGMLKAVTGVAVVIFVVVRGLAPYAKEAFFMTASAFSNAVKTVANKFSSAKVTRQVGQHETAAAA